MQYDKDFKLLKIPEDTAWDKSDKWYNLYSKFHSYMVMNHQYTKIYNIIDKILFTPVYNIHNGLINIKNWYKYIWEDRNFDSHFIYTILQRKLELTRDYQVSNNRHSDIAFTNRNITICLNLIEKIKNETYEMEYLDYTKDEWITLPSKNVSANESTGEKFKLVEVEIKTVSENLDEFFDKHKSSVRFMKKELEKNRPNYEKKVLAIYVAQYNNTKAKKLLFRILEEQLECWWD